MPATTLEPKPTPIDIDKHTKEMARRQAEQNAQRDEMLKCLNPAYARARERAKPLYLWTVTCKWFTGNEEGKGIYRLEEEVVTGQNENDAWARFCDKLEVSPSRRDWKPTFVRGKQLTVEAVEAAMEGDAEPNAEIPVVTLGSARKNKAKKK